MEEAFGLGGVFGLEFTFGLGRCSSISLSFLRIGKIGSQVPMLGFVILWAFVKLEAISFSLQVYPTVQHNYQE